MSDIDDEVNVMLEDYGIQIDCQNPLELSMIDDPSSKATGALADLLLIMLLAEDEYDDYEDEDEDPYDEDGELKEGYYHDEDGDIYYQGDK